MSHLSTLENKVTIEVILLSMPLSFLSQPVPHFPSKCGVHQRSDLHSYFDLPGHLNLVSAQHPGIPMSSSRRLRLLHPTPSHQATPTLLKIIYGTTNPSTHFAPLSFCSITFIDFICRSVIPYC